MSSSEDEDRVDPSLCHEYSRRLTEGNLPENEFKKIAEFVASIKESLFFDMQIVCSDVIFPCHKYVLSLRSEDLRKKFSSGINDLYETEFESDVIFALLRWCYTDDIHFKTDKLTLGLLQASFHFQMSSLFSASERMLLLCLNEKSYHKFYDIAKKVGANILVDKCLQFAQTQCDYSLIEQPTGSQDQMDKMEKQMSSHLQLKDMKSTSKEFVELANEDGGTNEQLNELRKIVNGMSRYLDSTDCMAEYSIRTLPTHKYVLNNRSKKLIKRPDFSADARGTERLLAKAIDEMFRWCYTDKISILVDKTILLNLLVISKRNQLFQLFEICEEILIATVNIASCFLWLITDRNFNTTNILLQCTHVLSAYWEGLQSYDVHELLKMILDKPLHRMQNLNLQCVTSEALIMILNDDCLVKIFKYISLADLSSIKRTCGRFSQLVDRRYEECGSKTLKICPSSLFEDIWNLENIGKFIDSLSIVYNRDFMPWDTIFPLVAKFCNRDLKKLCLHFPFNKNFMGEGLPCIKEILKNVDVIKINNFDYIDMTLSYCENLTEVYITVINLQLSTVWCAQNCNIKRLTLYYMRNDYMLKEICKILLHLEYLDFSCDALSLESSNSIKQLTNLKELRVSTHYSHNLEINLEHLANRNVLEYLSLNRIGITETSVNALADFIKLKELTLKGIGIDILPNTLSLFSRKLTKIEKLFFDSCYGITFREITKIICNHLELKELLIFSCTQIEFIDKENYLRLRKHRNLTIFLDIPVFKKTKKLISDYLSDFVQISTIPPNWNRWIAGDFT